MNLTTKLKLALSLAAIGGLLFTSVPAAASTNLFFPFSGYRFVGTFPTAATSYFYANGQIVNNLAGDITVEASLGHANGGYNAFLVYGTVNGFTPPGAQVKCEVFVTTQSTGATVANGWGVSGPPQGNPILRYSFTVATTPASGGAYFYTMRCTLPRGASIVGVRPTS